VVDVAVADDDAFEIIGRQLEHVQIVPEPVRGHAGVEQHAPGLAVVVRRDHDGKTMLGDQRLALAPAVVGRDLGAAHFVAVFEKDVDRVVEQDGDLGAVDGARRGVPCGHGSPPPLVPRQS